MKTWTEEPALPENPTAAEVAEAIVHVVEDLDWVSHGNLASRLGDRVMRGDMYWQLERKNVVLFVGISELALDAMNILRKERPHRIHLVGMSALSLMCDGAPIPAKMPWVKRRVPKNGYKKPHFAPCGFRPCSKDACSCPPLEAEDDSRFGN